VKITRHGAAVGLVAASVLLLAACGSDTNKPSTTAGASTTSNAPKVDCGGKNQLTGEGSSAQQNAITEIINTYNGQCPGFNVAYQATGSGAGVKQFNANKVDFAGSDSALSGADVQAAATRCGGNPAWDLPAVFGPIGIACNLPGLDGLVLNGEVAAKIFNGQIKNWNDPAIKALNGSLTLPDKPIVVLYRSDSSGTTDNFQRYLKAASKGAWTQGTGKDFAGHTGEGKQGSQGVSNAVKATDASITYVEWSFVQSAKLQNAKLDSGSGPVALTADTAGKAVASATIKGQGNDLVLDLDALYASNNPGVYPLVLGTYEIVCSKGYDAPTAQAVKAFLTVAASSGQDKLADIGYVPLPADFRTKVLTAISAIS
jgi:phosphate transport system substrate-binding protein